MALKQYLFLYLCPNHPFYSAHAKIALVDQFCLFAHSLINFNLLFPKGPCYAAYSQPEPGITRRKNREEILIQDCAHVYTIINPVVYPDLVNINLEALEIMNEM